MPGLHCAMSRARGALCALAVSLVSAHTVAAAVVTWRPNTSFNLPLNFLNGKVPCGRETVLFPDSLLSGVKISSVNDVESLILPENGELLLGDKASINFGASKESGSEECTAGETHYLEDSRSAWLRADSWDAATFNAATPDAQRRPCFDDDVVFPEDSQFYVVLPEVTQYVRSLTIGGNKIDQNRFVEIAESAEDPSQAFILNSAMGTGVVIRQEACRALAGCPCQTDAALVDCSAKACPAPACRDPVQPEGHCCFICGGILKFETNTNTFNFMSFERNVQETVARFGGPSRIVYHVGLLRKDRVQVVMVDAGEYDGSSALAAYWLGRRAGEAGARGPPQSWVSGAPAGKAGVAGAALAAWCLLAALALFAAVYVWFYRSNGGVTLPRIPFPASNMFSRFENRANSVVSLTSRGAALGSSFRNPLYNSRRVQPVGASVEVVGEETPDAEPRGDLVQGVARMSSLLPAQGDD